MMPYHNNQLTMVGLESDEEYHSFPTPRSNKRKRDSAFGMLPQDNMFGDQECVRDGDLNPFNEIDGASYDDVNPFANAHRVDQVEGEVQDNLMYDPSFANWAMNPFAEVHGSFASDWNLNNYSDDTAVFNGTPNTNLTTANDQFHSGFDGETVNNGAEHTLSHAPGSTGTTGDAAEGYVKIEDSGDDVPVSYTPFGADESDESDYGDQRPAKVPKLNKDGVPRKPRQPRPKLLKWNDDDWKRVCLGIVWACGDNGIQIPFEQASQVVSDSCTAGALQQALLKLRAKQIAEGHQIPALKMAWTRKGRNPAPTKTDANANTSQGTLRKKPTRVASGQALIVRLRRPYREDDRLHLAYPYIFTGLEASTSASRRLSSWHPPASWMRNDVPEHLIGPADGIRQDIRRQSMLKGSNNRQDRADTALNPATTLQEPGSDSDDAGCLDGVVQKARDVSKKGKGKAKDLGRRTKASVPKFVKDAFSKKDRRGGPGGTSGGGVST